MNKTLYLVSNAHLDPVWQWEWEEGAAAAVSTFRTAAAFCRERDNYIFCHNEAALYEWVEEYEPALFEEIKALVNEGKWIIIGGWYIQPDCNMPAGETFVRHAVYGRKYFFEKFGVVPTVANSFDAFGHSRGLVQILAKTGYKYYIHCRPGGDFLDMPNTYKWIGYDGSSVIGRREPHGYGSGLGAAAAKASWLLGMVPDGGKGVALWGVGDHGGGASAQDLDALDEFIKEAAKNGDTVKHSDLYEYLETVDESTLPLWERDINPWAVGCYTSQAKLKSMYRALEDMYYFTEKICVLARPLREYPKDALDEAEKAMLFATFHDYLPGSSVEPVEAMGIRQLGGAYDKLTKLRTAAFFALCSGFRKAAPDEIPVIVCNPHPYEAEDVYEAEFMLWDQGWGEFYKYPHVFDEDGNELPCQPEKELSNIPIDWRKRVAFRAKMPASSAAMFLVKFKDVKKPPIVGLPRVGEFLRFDNGRMKAYISLKTGLISSLIIDGKELVDPSSGGALRLDVIRDNCDPWGMTVRAYRDREGSFTLVNDEEAAKFCAVDHPLAPVRVIENGSVRTVVEAIFGYNDSRAVVRYSLSKHSPEIDVSVRLQMYEKQKAVKLTIPASNLERVLGQTAYGSEPLLMNGEETVSQRYKLMDEGEKGILISARSTYGSSVEGNEYRITLLRTAAYTAHPLGDRKILPDDRFMPHIDVGTGMFDFRLTLGDTRVLEPRAERLTQLYCEKPFSMSFFPSGAGEKLPQGIRLEGDDSIVLTAAKKSEYGKGTVLRLFNPTATDRTATLSGGVFVSGPFEVTVPARAFETYLVEEDGSVKNIPADEAETRLPVKRA
ncbi:MAG: alpha-mannosidase [Clostridia bacterium]|nr:alpha-mannosidase [Clostridia bacterium]